MNPNDEIMASAREFARTKKTLSWDQCVELARRYHKEMKDWDNKPEPGKVKTDDLPF